ncbi:MAG: DUF4339 domain-containing protein [Verrucomicrobiota bacterium]
MQIHIHKNGQQPGPFPESRIAEMLKSGEAAESDLAWSEGMESWKPLSSFAQFHPPLSGHPAPRTPAFLK